MSCQQIQRELSAYLDGEVSPARQADIAAHLQECASCRSRAAELHRLGQGLRALPNVPVPAQFLANVHRQIRAAQPATVKPGWFDALFRPAWLKLPVEALAVVAVVATVALWTRAPQRPATVAEAGKSKLHAPQSVGPVSVTLAPEPREELALAATAPAPAAPPTGLAAEKDNVMALAEVDAADRPKTELKETLREVAGGPADLLRRSHTETAAAAERVPAETIKIQSDQFEPIQASVTELAQSLQGKVMTMVASAGVQRVYVELPAANVAAFKDRLLAASRPSDKTVVYASRPMAGAGLQKKPLAKAMATADGSGQPSSGPAAGADRQEPVRVLLEIEVAPSRK